MNHFPCDQDIQCLNLEQLDYVLHNTPDEVGLIKIRQEILQRLEQDGVIPDSDTLFKLDDQCEFWLENYNQGNGLTFILVSADAVTQRLDYNVCMGFITIGRLTYWMDMYRFSFQSGQMDGSTGQWEKQAYLYPTAVNWIYNQVLAQYGLWEKDRLETQRTLCERISNIPQLNP